MLASTRKVEFDQTLAQLIHFVAGGTFLAGFFKAMLQTMPFKNPFDVWSLICKYSTARAWLLYYRKKKMSFNLRLSSACIVHLRTAKNFIKQKKSLNKHFRLYPTHKPESLKNSHKRISTKEISEAFLSGEQPYSRRQRVRELMSHLTDEEISELALPRVTKVVPPVDFFLQGSSSSGDVFQKLVTFREQICLRFPELVTFFYSRTSLPFTLQSPKQKFIDFVLDNKSNCCELLLEQDNGSLFRGFLVPLVFKTYYSAFKDFSCGIVGEFGISQKDTQDVLRNKLGKKLEKVLRINPILSKDEIFGKLNDTRQELLEKVGLKFNEFGEVVVGYVDVEKYITLFLSQAGLQSAITAPNDTIIIMDYTDSFP